MKLSLLLDTHATRTTHTFKKYAKTTQMMYMGSLSESTSEYQLARGFTASHGHKDTNHCLGLFQGHDCTLIHRMTPFGRIVITTVDLQVSQFFDHFFILPVGISPQWFGAILAHHPYHRYAPYAPRDAFKPAFKDTYSVFSVPTHFLHALQHTGGDVAKIIAAHSAQNYIYEITDKSLLIYNFSADEPSARSLDMQMHHASSLAAALESPA